MPVHTRRACRRRPPPPPPRLEVQRDEDERVPGGAANHSLQQQQQQQQGAGFGGAEANGNRPNKRKGREARGKHFLCRAQHGAEPTHPRRAARLACVTTTTNEGTASTDAMSATMARALTTASTSGSCLHGACWQEVPWTSASQRSRGRATSEGMAAAAAAACCCSAVERANDGWTTLQTPYLPTCTAPPTCTADLPA